MGRSGLMSGVSLSLKSLAELQPRSEGPYVVEPSGRGSGRGASCPFGFLSAGLTNLAPVAGGDTPHVVHATVMSAKALTRIATRQVASATAR